MKRKLSIHSSSNDLIRLKKSIQFIREVVRSYEVGLIDHVGFSCALAISKAEELEHSVWRFCPVRTAFTQLTSVLKQLYEKRIDAKEASPFIEEISAYFNLDRYELAPRQTPPLNQEKLIQ